MSSDDGEREHAKGIEGINEAAPADDRGDAITALPADEQKDIDDFLVRQAMRTLDKENLHKPEVVSSLQATRRSVIEAVLMLTAFLNKSGVKKARQ